MADKFDWKSVLGDTEAPANPAAEEGLLVDPRNGELVAPPPVEPNHAGPVREGDAATYKPAYVDRSIHSMELKDKYDIGVEAGVAPAVETGEEVLSLDNVHIDEILRMALERKASDIHLTV